MALNVECKDKRVVIKKEKVHQEKRGPERGRPFQPGIRKEIDRRPQRPRGNS